ncbi:YeaH/YhbH family protein [Acidomonas methanolica]|uniref:YeaH/YhbH family protein n=1 Tax=Acidomonas methanolica TaxID=437 RepID=UPI00211A861F|nr:YeaH/YhbH family protein [Acidomonas methanolica]MCQ9154592.1 YeaH/YhbH family protein [Acidomonas methanolica]
MEIIDRRPNPHGKNTENRRRVLVRARNAVQTAVREAVSQGRIRDNAQSNTIDVPADVLHEPSFHRVFTQGVRQFVLPGNREFVPGDKLRRPPGGAGGEGGNGEGEASAEGGGEDSYRFVLSRDEFLDLFFDDLELPDLVKREIATTTSLATNRAGLSSDGSPSQLDLGRTMRHSVARRIGLKRPKPARLQEIEAEIAALEEKTPLDEADYERLQTLREEREIQSRRLIRIPWVDPVDLRYRRFTPVPKPTTQAVMFCIMDVSGSMTEKMKELGKQFFLLLHVFLERRYEKLDIVFIRHAETAEEVDEETFFTDPRTGGTVVSTALEVMLSAQKARYPVDRWNIYVAQASDGDNISSDKARVMELMTENILPIVQYFAYIEVVGSGAIIRNDSDLWRCYRELSEASPHLAIRQVRDRKEIFPVFRELFARRKTAK